jgi:hypothetical protein
MDSIQESKAALAGRLEELGVSASRDQVEELAAAYPALVEWMRIAEELAGEPAKPGKGGAET